MMYKKHTDVMYTYNYILSRYKMCNCMPSENHTLCRVHTLVTHKQADRESYITLTAPLRFINFYPPVIRDNHTWRFGYQSVTGRPWRALARKIIHQTHPEPSQTRLCSTVVWELMRATLSTAEIPVKCLIFCFSAF